MGMRYTPNVNPLVQAVTGQSVAQANPAIAEFDPNEFNPPTQAVAAVDEAAPAVYPTDASTVPVPVTESVTTTTENVYRQEDLDALNAASAKQVAAIQGSVDVLQQATKYEDEVANNAIAEARAKQALMLKEEQDFQTEVKKKKEAYNQAYADYASYKVDPNRFWANKSTGDKIGMVLLAAIGGGAAGYSGRQGPDFVGMIDRAIQNDIEQQKSEAERLKGKAELANNQYAQAYSIYNNELQAKLAVQAAGYDIVKATLLKKEGQIKNATALANLKTQMAEIDRAQALTVAEMNKQQKQTQSATKGVKPDPKTTSDKQEKYTIFGQAKDKDNVTKIDMATMQLKKIIRDTDRLNELYDKFGTKEYADAEASGELLSLQNAYIEHLRVAANAGTLGTTERGEFQKMLGTTWTRAESAKKFVNTFKESFLRGTTDLVNNGVPSMPKKLTDSQLLAKLYYGETNKESAKYGGKSQFMVQSDARNKSAAVARK